MKKLSMSLLVALAVIFAISSAFTTSNLTFQHPASGLYQSVDPVPFDDTYDVGNYNLDPQVDFNLNELGTECDDIDPEVLCGAYITVNGVDDEEITYIKFKVE